MKFLNIQQLFGRKSMDNSSQRIASILPPGTFMNLSGGLKGMLGQIYSFFTDDGETFDHLKTLNRARNYALVDPVVNSFIRIMTHNSIGYTGLQLQARVHNAAGESLTDVNSKLEKLWCDFTKAKNFDITGRFSCNDFLFNAISQYIIDGEIVIRKFKNTSSKYGVQYQLLEFGSIDFNINKGNVFNGVEVDGFLRPVFYHLKSANGKTTRVPASEIIHVIRPIPGQVGSYRGLSLLAPALPLLKDINTFRKTELQAAINEATKVISYESDYQYGKAYEGASSAADIANYKPGAPADSNSGMSPERQAELLLMARQNTQIVNGGLGIEALPPGVKLSQLSSTHPNPASAGFAKSYYTVLAAGLGVSYITLMQDLQGANYSGSRATYIAERPTYRKIRSMIIEQVLDPIYEEFVSGLINSGKLPEAKLVDNSFEAYLDHDYIGLGWESVDPTKDANAAVTLIEAGLMAPSTYTMERGVDWEDHLKTIQRDKALMEKYGVTLTEFTPPTQSKPAPIEAPEGSEEVPQDPKSAPQEPSEGSESTPLEAENEPETAPKPARKSRKKAQTEPTSDDSELLYKQ